MLKRSEFIHPRFVLGEGFEDASFIAALLKARNLPNFDVSPNDDIGNTGGDTGFEEAVIGCEPMTGFTAVTDVVIVADNDGQPADAFSKVCAQIEKARNAGNLQRNWGTATNVAGKAPGDPSVSIWMWPAPGEPGCLETLLWRVILDIYAKEAKCVEDACQCSGADGWPISKRDKARVRCFLSLVCKRNPAVLLGLLWRDQPKIIPLKHAAFDPISRFLAAI